ncbi:hypothetical protein [Cohnella silvisoli]|uniref:YokE-like PH domain-containing protein n=1 Tax=Cohnella silvisoli TaxID=2873699 RepID=A0ABV1KS17_9BACL|nr:hypothetical protein [Cohnella silvisoli]MCD9022606.1 hypothetical protein [Cohnella silvisoli]
MALVSGGATVACIAGLSMLHRQLTALPPYRPGKGFWFYRLTGSRKNRVLTVGQVFILLLIIGSLWFGDFSRHTLRYAIGYAIGSAIGGIALIQYVIKPRIKLHTPVDDAALFELEDLGIIRPDEIVIGMYKDFQSWVSASGGAKILLLTPDRLIAIRMSTPDEGERTEIRLSDIDRLGLIGHGKKGEGLILSVGLLDGSIIRFMLLGSSYKYSPEQFIQQLLELLDKRFTTQEGVSETVSALRVRPEGHPPVLQNSNPVFRPLDLQRQSAVPASDTPHQPSVTNQRFLDS